MPCFAGAILYGGADRLPRVPAPFNICVNTTFKSLAGFVRKRFNVQMSAQNGATTRFESWREIN